MEKNCSKVKTFFIALGILIAAIFFQIIVGVITTSVVTLTSNVPVNADSGANMVYEIPGLMSTLQFVVDVVSIIVFGIIYYVGFVKKDKVAGTYESPTKKVLDVKNLIYILSVIVIGSSLTFVVYAIQTKIMSDRVDSLNDMLNSGLAQTIFGYIAIFVAAPIAEELIVRGVIGKIAKKSFGLIGCMIISALFFSIFHMNLVQSIYTIPVGLAFGYLAYRFNSVVPSMIGHILHNSFGGFLFLKIGAVGEIVALIVFTIIAILVGKKLDIIKKDEVELAVAQVEPE